MINEKRNIIRNELFASSDNIKCGKLEKFADSDLYLLFRIYDNLYLNDWFKNNFEGIIINFKFSRRLKSSAGITKCQKNISIPEKQTFEIDISADFLFDYHKVDRDIYVNGIKTEDSLDALMLVFEHELCHVLENLQYGKTSCRGKRFKNMAYMLFGHTDVTHALPTNYEINQLNYKLKIGDRAAFEFEGKAMQGIINRINKRATVMVENQNGKYIDRLGKRYQKFYVPLDMLHKILNLPL